MAKGSIKARIQCTVEILVGTWSGGQTDLDSLSEQVKREGVNIIEKMIGERRGKVVGQQKVIFVVLEED